MGPHILLILSPRIWLKRCKRWCPTGFGKRFVLFVSAALRKKKADKFDEHEPFSREKLGTGTIYLNRSNLMHLMSNTWESQKPKNPWVHGFSQCRIWVLHLTAHKSRQINTKLISTHWSFRRTYFEQEEATNNWRSCRNHEDPRLLPIALLCFLLCLRVSSSSVCCRQSWNRPLMSITWCHDGAQTWKNPLGRTWWIVFCGSIAAKMLWWRLTW